MLIDALDSSKILYPIEIDKLKESREMFVSCLYDYISTHFSVHLTIFSDRDCEQSLFA